MSIDTASPRHQHEVVADNLAAELARKRMSGRATALALGVNHVWVARRVNGEVELSVSDVVRFADLLGIDPGVLFEGTKNAPTPKGGGNKLPELDSNQQPAGIKPGQVIPFPNLGLDTTGDTGSEAEIIPMFG